MAVIEICDICKEKVDKEDGITVECSDANGLTFSVGKPERCRRNYKLRICNECVENIKKYCRKSAFKRFVDDYEEGHELKRCEESHELKNYESYLKAHSKYGKERYENIDCN